jgi:uncharacterized Zn-binding protein involved in type VI secretion
MPAAARLTDPTAHPGTIAGPGVSTVLIEGLPAAVAAMSQHVCAFPGLPPHPPNPILKGSSTVTIGGLPAARMGDPCGCGATILAGATRTSIGG